MLFSGVLPRTRKQGEPQAVHSPVSYRWIDGEDQDTYRGVPDGGENTQDPHVIF